jgi:hypothetical protein
MFTQKQNEILISYIKSKIDNFYDPSLPVIADKDLVTLSNFPHKGFYIGVIDAKEEDVVRMGLMRENLTDVVASADAVCQMVYDYCKLQNIPKSKIQTSTFYITVITDVQYISMKDSWDETKDGVYFQWGQDFKGLYLPYEIQRMSLSKIEILDRLLSDEIKIASNLWKLPEGLIFKLSCISIKS